MATDELRRILVPVDFSEASANGLLVAAEIARRFDARLTVLHIEIATSAFTEALTGTNTPADVEAVVRSHRQTLHERLEGFVSRYLGEAARVEAVVIDDIFVADAIVRHAEERGMDLICMGGTGHRAIERLVLGDTAARVLRHSHVPVLTLRSRRDDGAAFVFDDFRRVLVAVDLGEGSRRVVEMGAALARPRGELTVMHVIESAEERGLYRVPLQAPAEDVRAAVEWCEGALGDLLTEVDPGIVAPVRVVVGRPGAGVLAVERETEPDVTVVGTHGRHGLERLVLGSVAERVARRALGPVLVVPNLPYGAGAKTH
ncbi:MAG: universal stress protein [Planctomycetota bacterium]|jgi:nucleotide-binding universal stress UspA family protein